eukprot:Hpha_TRINITY_DN282_c0_g1::TRINITY_DN282_c0_g1_i1::g.83556::m.83556
MLGNDRGRMAFDLIQSGRYRPGYADRAANTSAEGGGATAAINYRQLAMVLVLTLAGVYAVVWVPVTALLRYAGVLSTPQVEAGPVRRLSPQEVAALREDISSSASMAARMEKRVDTLYCSLALKNPPPPDSSGRVREDATDLGRILAAANTPFDEGRKRRCGETVIVKGHNRGMLRLRFNDGKEELWHPAALQP